MKKELKILMLEDSSTDAELIRRFLLKEYTDCHIQLAITRNEFLDTLENFRPDLILADNSLPQFDATEALRIVRERGILIPFIMVSGTTKEEYAVQIIKAGADDYILKDRLTRLPAAIESAFRHRDAEAEKHRVQQALEQSEEKYRTIVDRVSDGFMLLDRLWTVVYANPKADRIFGKPAGFMEGKKMDVEFPQAVGRPFFNAYKEVLEINTQVSVEEYSIVAEQWLRAVFYPSENGVAVFFHDITSQRKAELEVKRSEERYMSVISRISDGFIVLDNNRTILFVNPTTEHFFNRPADSMVGKNINEDLPKAIQETPFYKTFIKAVQSGTNQYLDAYSDYLSRWLLVNYYPSPDGVAIFFRDITNLKIAEEQKRITQLELIRSEEKYRAIVDRISDGFIIMDKKWTVLYANQVVDTLFGKPAGYLLGKKMNLEFPQAVGKPFFNAYLEAIEKGEKLFIEEYSVVADRLVQANLYPSENGVAVFFRDITEQRKAEAEVKRSEEQFRVLLERISDGFMILDREWRTLYVNRAAEKMFNRPPGYLLGKRMQDEFPGSEKRPFLMAYQEVIDTGEKKYLEEYAPTIDCWLQASIYPTDEGVAVFFRDITIRKKAEAAALKARLELEKSETKYRNMVERISDGFMVMDREWRVTYINPVAEKLLQRPAGYLMGKKMQDEFPGSMDRPFFTAYDEAMRTGQNKYIEEYSISIDRWFQASIYPSADGVAVFFRDITEQRKAEEEVRRSEEKYRVFIHRITDAFISLDRNWCYTYLNKQAGELVQRNPDELIGKSVWAVFPDAMYSATYKAFHQALEEQRYISNVDYYAPLDLWQENHIYPSTDGISVFIRNITEKKKLEQELQNQQRKEQHKMMAVAIEAQEKERNAIAAELHDNVNQILVGTKVMLSVIRDHPEKSVSMLQNCMDNLLLAIQENRKIAHELVSPNLNNETLVEQLVKLGDEMLRSAGIETVNMFDDFSEGMIGEKQKLAVYRIAQEQCTNIIKYAQANTVIMTLTAISGTILFRISDDGAGADPGKNSKGIGLQNMTNRIAVFGGHLQIKTKPGEGFEVEASFPAAI